MFRRISIFLFLSIGFSAFAQTNIFGHYETPTIGIVQFVHLRPDSTYIAYSITDTDLPITLYEDIEPKRFRYAEGKIHLSNYTYNFDSVFVLTDTLHLVPMHDSHVLHRKVFYDDEGAIKYAVQGIGYDYKLQSFHNNYLTSVQTFKNNQRNGAFERYYPLDSTTFSRLYKSFMKDKDPLNWRFMTAFMEVNCAIYQSTQIRGNWFNGSKDGWWFFYNQDGSVDRKEKYKNGRLIKSR